MITQSSRDDLERALGRALSRHIGYTTGAYDLPRILAVVDIFSDRASAYKEEITAFLSDRARSTDERDNSENYFSEIINFAQAMGLVETVSAREAGLQRLAATELGRSLLGAKAAGNAEFYRFFVARTVVLADADALVCLLQYFAGPRSEGVIEFFLGFQTSLRNRRRDWLIAAFPEKILLARIASHIPWLTLPKRRLSDWHIEVPTLNTARHHATPRQGWLQDLEMFDRATKTLSPFGKDVLEALSPDQEYFWLGPPQGVEEALRIEATVSGTAREDTLTFCSSERQPRADEVQSLIESVAEIMTRGFESAKLIHASQASLKLPIEYILYRSYKDKANYNWETILDETFKIKRPQLERFSAQKGKIGFYKRKVV